MTELPISRIPNGHRFSLILETTGRKINGTVLYKTTGSVAVRIDSNGTREFQKLNKKTGNYDTVQVKASASIEHWSLGTLITPIVEGSPQCVSS